MQRWQRAAIEESNIVEFIRLIKMGIKLGLEAYSLELVEIELYHQPDKLVLTPNSEAWRLRIIAENPITKQKKEANTQFQGHIGDTAVDDVKEMVADIVGKFKVAFYGV